MRLLHIESSPHLKGAVSRELAADFVCRLKTYLPELPVTFRDLVRDPPPPIDQAWADALFLPPGEHTEAMRAALAPSETYIAELQEADFFLFSMPMHNFTVPAPFKTWIDHMARPGRTFGIGNEGTYGLLEGKRALAITSRGGYYHTADPASDFQEPYLRKIMSFIGVTDVAFVHAEGMDMGREARKAGLGRAEAELERHARLWGRGSE
ncbi:MAG: FMN-dependent NADH-azoreductase [Alphaproteobacteria bacterium]